KAAGLLVEGSGDGDRVGDGLGRRPTPVREVVKLRCANRRLSRKADALPANGTNVDRRRCGKLRYWRTFLAYGTAWLVSDPRHDSEHVMRRLLVRVRELQHREIGLWPADQLHAHR